MRDYFCFGFPRPVETFRILCRLGAWSDDALEMLKDVYNECSRRDALEDSNLACVLIFMAWDCYRRRDISGIGLADRCIGKRLAGACEEADEHYPSSNCGFIYGQPQSRQELEAALADWRTGQLILRFEDGDGIVIDRFGEIWADSHRDSRPAQPGRSEAGPFRAAIGRQLMAVRLRPHPWPSHLPRVELEFSGGALLQMTHLPDPRDGPSSP